MSKSQIFRVIDTDWLPLSPLVVGDMCFTESGREGV